MDKMYYIIVMLCIDGYNQYIDYVKKRFDDKEKAIEEMFRCANGEFKDLEDIGNYELVNLGEEIKIYDEEKQLLTSYKIIEI